MSDTTDVVGYFNGNTYPILLDLSSAYGLSFTLAPGEYVQATGATGEKVKINDPALNPYVGKNGRLSRFVLKEGRVPVIRLMDRDARGQVPAVRTASITPTADGKVHTPTLPPPAQEVGSRASVKSMSIEEAIAAGYIPKPRIINRPEVPETAGAPYSGESIPEITYEDADVRHYKPAKQLTRAAVQDSVVLNVPPPQERVIPPPTASTVKPVEVPTIPLPSLQDVDEALVPAHPSGFICDLCTPPKVFKYRSQLESFLKAKYPDQVQEYMARYPKVQPSIANPVPLDT